MLLYLSANTIQRQIGISVREHNSDRDGYGVEPPTTTTVQVVPIFVFERNLGYRYKVEAQPPPTPKMMHIFVKTFQKETDIDTE